MRRRFTEGDRVRVFFGQSTAPGAQPCDGVVGWVCCTVRGYFVELDAPPPVDAFNRLRINGGDRYVLAYDSEVEALG